MKTGEKIYRAETILLFLALPAALSVPALQYLFRYSDDSRLTDLLHVYLFIEPASVISLSALATVLAFLLALLWNRLIKIEPGFHAQAAFLSALAFLISVFTWPVPEVIVDAARYFTQAKYLELRGPHFFFGEWGREIFIWTDLPLVPFIYGLGFSVFGEHREVIQALNSLFFALTVFLAAVFGRRLFGPVAGLYGAALLLAVPYLYTQVPLMLVDVGSMFALISALYMLWLAAEGREKGTGGNIRITVLAGIVFFLAMMVKYSLWVFLSTGGIIALVALYEGRGQGGFLRVAGAVALGLGFFGAVFVLSDGVLYRQLEFLLAYQGPGLKRWGVSYAATLFFQTHPFFTLSALGGAVAALFRKNPRALMLLWIPLIYLVLEIKRTRYTLPAFPVLAMLGGYGLSLLPFLKLRRFIALSAVVAALVLMFAGFKPYLTGLNPVNLKAAAAYLDTLEAPAVEVEAVPQGTEAHFPVSVPLMDIYLKKPFLYRHLPAQDRGWEEIETSSLRFTWHYRSPAFYHRPPVEGGPLPLVLIRGEENTVELESVYSSYRERGYRRVRTFDKTRRVFSYSTIVEVWLPEQSP